MREVHLALAAATLGRPRSPGGPPASPSPPVPWPPRQPLPALGRLTCLTHMPPPAEWPPPCPPRANAWHRPPLGAWPCCSASLSIPQPHTLRSAPCSVGIPQPGKASALTILSASPARPRLGPGDASARGCHDTAQWLQFRGWKSDQGVLGQLLPRPCGRICPPPCPGVAGDARVPPLRCLPSSSQALPLGTAAPRVHLI